MLLLEFLAGGLANAVTSALLNPLDIAKTRMQTAPAALSLRGTLSALHAEGGLRAVFLPGMAASVIREMIYSGAKAGLYVPLRGHFGGESPAAKVAAALCTGTLGSLLANPIDVVKIRLMADARRYPSTAAAIPIIFRAEGLAGFYRGLAPSTLRGACVSAGELATYDVAKGLLREALFSGRDGVALHVAASLVTGCVAACVAAPFDLIKARAMSSARPEGIASVLRQLAREGALPLGLFRGLVPAYLRLGPHALIAFPIFEQLRRLFGLEYL
jgi:hypothetical protein